MSADNESSSSMAPASASHSTGSSAIPLHSQPSTSTPTAPDEHLMCRVCRGEEGNLYYPCLCTGSIKYVHQECLTEWLKYSKKEVCELCNYKYSFQPIYRPDMPKALPLTEIIKGVWWNGLSMVRTWLLYTLVLSSWLIFVPIAAARIYHAVFYSSFHDLFLLPFQLFRADHIIADISKGSLLLALFVCTFISLVWLREQIVLGGPQDFLNIAEVMEGGEQVANEEEEQYIEESEREEEGNGTEDSNQEDTVEDEQNIDLEAEAEVRAGMMLHEMERIEAGEDGIAAVNAVDREVGGGEDAAQPAEAGQQPQEGEDNWRDWDRFEELTWQRLLGLDGSLVFIEHLFWVISLNTLFTIVFAFSPYKVGSMFLHWLGVLPRIHYFPSILSILTGYVTVAVFVYFIHSFVHVLRLRTLYRLLGICFLVLKVFLLVLIEIGLFPIICGCWMDLCSLTLFSTSLSSRIAAFSASPTAFVFIRWMTGMVYVFYSASFVLLLREVLRPGVLFFLRNLNDPDFNPIQEMIELPVSRHIRRLIASTSLFFTTILLILFIPLNLIIRFLPSVLPYNISFSADTPLSELSLELLVLQVVMPALLEQTNGRNYLKALVHIWCIYVGRLLSLEGYLLSENQRAGNGNEQRQENEAAENINEEEVRDAAGDAQPQAANNNLLAQGGGLAAQHQALLLLREPRQDEPYVRPNFFVLRIIALLCLLALSWCLSALICLTVPVTLGRLFIYFAFGMTNVHELYTVACGLYSCWLVGKLVHILYTFFTQSNTQLRHLVLGYLTLALRIAFVALPIVLLIPYLLGMYFHLVAITPIRLTYRQTPIQFPKQEWAMGLLHMKIFCAAVMTGPDWWMKAAFEQIYQDGLQNLHVGRILSQLLLPVILCLLTLIAAPACITHIFSFLLDLPVDQSVVLVYYSYPFFLFLLVLCAFLRWQLLKLRQLAEKIKNDKYLIGTRLVNYERHKQPIK